MCEYVYVSVCECGSVDVIVSVCMCMRMTVSVSVSVVCVSVCDCECVCMCVLAHCPILSLRLVIKGMWGKTNVLYVLWWLLPTPSRASHSQVPHPRLGWALGQSSQKVPPGELPRREAQARLLPVGGRQPPGPCPPLGGASPGSLCGGSPAWPATALEPPLCAQAAFTVNDD